MELDDLKKMIQDFFQENTITIIGSGLSVAEGIPGMNALARELQSKLPAKLKEINDLENWGRISSHLSAGIGLEEALHLDKPTERVEEGIREITANYIRNAETDTIEAVITGKRSFRLSSYLSKFNIRNLGLTIITTNYDRLIEYCCELDGIRIDTLFVGKYISKFDPDESKNSFCARIIRTKSHSRVEYAPKVKVLKPHGCLSWQAIDGVPFSIPQNHRSDCLIITPGLNKYKVGYNEPFDTHRAHANSSIDSAARYIIIGYGFGDEHLETHLMRQINSKKPTMIITRTLSQKAKEVVAANKNVLAISCHNSGSIVNYNGEEKFFDNTNMWDIREMVQEVF